MCPSNNKWLTQQVGLLTVLVFLLAHPLPAQANSAQTTLLPGKPTTVNIRRTATVRVPSTMQVNLTPTCSASVFRPNVTNEDLRKPARAVVLVFGAGGDNQSMFGPFSQVAANRSDVIIIATNPAPTNDSEVRAVDNVSCGFSLIAWLQSHKLVSYGVRIIAGGFSGGAKMAMMVGVLASRQVDGVIAVGCNVDLASYAYRLFKRGPEALKLPILLVNGTRDPLVVAYTPKVLESLQSTGFTRVRHISYTGSHELPLHATRAALSYLLR